MIVNINKTFRIKGAKVAKHQIKNFVEVELEDENKKTWYGMFVLRGVDYYSKNKRIKEIITELSSSKKIFIGGKAVKNQDRIIIYSYKIT